MAKRKIHTFLGARGIQLCEVVDTRLQSRHLIEFVRKWEGWVVDAIIVDSVKSGSREFQKQWVINELGVAIERELIHLSASEILE